ncbi:MAG: lamin tail domain-containing protein [Saprospiraceae bacterium]
MIFKFRKSHALGLIICIACFPLFINAQDVIITEIMQNPSAVSDANGEWVEIYNTTNAAIDIEGWTIKDDDSDSHTINNSMNGVMIPPESYFVLGKNGDINSNGGVNIDYTYSSFTLSNGTDEVILLDASMMEFERVEYDNGSTFPDPNGASMALLDLTSDNNVGANWTTSAVLTYGSGDYGTPGDKNEPEAKIDNTTYKTILQAINTAQEEDAVHLLQDVTSDIISITENIELYGNMHTITSTSTTFGIAVTSPSAIFNISIVNAGSNGIHVDCDSDYFVMQNISVNNSGATGIAINGSDNVGLTDITSTNNGGNGLSITNCTDLTVTNITTSGNTFLTFGAGVGIFTSDQFCPGNMPGITSGIEISGMVNISEQPSIYEQAGNGTISNTTLPSSIGSHFIGIAGNQKFYTSFATNGFAGVAQLINGNPPVSADLLYVTDVATGKRLVCTAAGMTITGALVDQAPQTIYTISLVDGIFTDPISEIPQNIKIEVPSGVTFINNNTLINKGTLDISAGGTYTNNGTYTGFGTFIGDFVNPSGGTVTTIQQGQ